jgi:hypothetical protein
MEFRPAVRKASPMMIATSGVSGSGKTYGSLLLAAGIAGPTGKVGFIDTENGRGSMYADSPGIVKALPNGYLIAQLDPPFSPDRYIEAIVAAEKSGVSVLVIDSATHEWEGIGGCAEIAETQKLKGMPNWSKAKMLHKRFMNHCLTSNMHIIFCLRAREKTKIVKVNGKEEFVNVGIQPIAEKNFVFEMTVSLHLDEKTHFASPIKVPEPLAHLFPEGKLITKEDGERIRQWNETGSALDPLEQLIKRSRTAAEQGRVKYREFVQSLTPDQKKRFPATIHEQNKKTAEEADQIPVFGSVEDTVQWPDDFSGPECYWNGKHLRFDDETGNYREVNASHAA